MTNRLPVVLAALLVLGACKPAATPQAVADSTIAAAAAAATDLVDASVRTAAAISNAMKSYPAKGDSILAAANLTAEQFEAMMKRIAADSTLSADYKRLTQ
ncbi:MAG: hypothetical protein ABJB33_10135 [Gemmatimonadota bacterium]